MFNNWIICRCFYRLLPTCGALIFGNVLWVLTVNSFFWNFVVIIGNSLRSVFKVLPQKRTCICFCPGSGCTPAWVTDRIHSYCDVSCRPTEQLACAYEFWVDAGNFEVPASCGWLLLDFPSRAFLWFSVSPAASGMETQDPLGWAYVPKVMANCVLA